jgi:hypothetical protein
MSLPVSASQQLDIAMRSGNVQIQKNIQMETMELSAESKAQLAAHNKHMASFNVTQRARTIIVPTAVEEVKAKLRLFGHPVTFFGEGPADRRRRLQEVCIPAHVSLSVSGSVYMLSTHEFLPSLLLTH